MIVYTGAVGGAVWATARFDQQMRMVSTMVDDTEAHMGQFTQAIRRMSIEFGEGTDTLSRGLYDILSASIDASKATEVLRAGVMAAKGGMTDAAVSIDAITGHPIACSVTP